MGGGGAQFYFNVFQEGVEKDLKIAALQEQCEELLDAQLDAQHDANFERRTSKEAVSAEEVQALRKENEELRQRLRDTVNELAALQPALGDGAEVLRTHARADHSA